MPITVNFTTNNEGSKNPSIDITGSAFFVGVGAFVGAGALLNIVNKVVSTLINENSTTSGDAEETN